MNSTYYDSWKTPLEGVEEIYFWYGFFSFYPIFVCCSIFAIFITQFLMQHCKKNVLLTQSSSLKGVFFIALHTLFQTTLTWYTCKKEAGGGRKICCLCNRFLLRRKKRTRIFHAVASYELSAPYFSTRILCQEQFLKSHWPTSASFWGFL